MKSQSMTRQIKSTTCTSKCAMCIVLLFTILLCSAEERIVLEHAHALHARSKHAMIQKTNEKQYMYCTKML